MQLKKQKNKKWFFNKVRHGLFMYGVTNRLAKMGIEFRPYYWELENVTTNTPPKIKGDTSEYTIKYLDSEDIKFICANGLGYDLQEKLDKLNNGQLCVGLMHKDKISAYSWIELNELNFRKKKVSLKENESYLGGMFTVELYRGRNLATYLRYQSYKILNEKGIDTIYSISDYFNYPAIKFKKKLNSKHKKLYLYIEIFNKFKFSFLLRKFKV